MQTAVMSQMTSVPDVLKRSTQAPPANFLLLAVLSRISLDWGTKQNELFHVPKAHLNVD